MPINKIIRDAAKSGNLEKLAEFNIKDLLTPDELGNSALLIAAKNKHTELVKFIIDESLKQDQQLLLHKALTNISITSNKNILHIAVFTPDNTEIITLLVNTANKLNIPDYINIKDPEYQSTALHMASRQALLSNIQILIKLGASVTAKANIEDLNDSMPIQLVCYQGNKDQMKACLTYFMRETKPGCEYFEKRYGLLKGLDEKEINEIFNIELDIALTSNPYAQFAALQSIMQLIQASPSNLNFLNNLFAALSLVNYAHIHEALLYREKHKLTAVDAKEDAEKNKFTDVIHEATQFAKAQTKDDFAIHLYVRAKLLFQIDGDRAQLEALSTYEELITRNSELALLGLKSLQPDSFKNERNQMLFFRCQARATATSELKTYKKRLSFFERWDYAPKIKHFIDNIWPDIASINEEMNKLPHSGPEGALRRHLQIELEKLPKYKAKKINEIKPSNLSRN